MRTVSDREYRAWVEFYRTEWEHLGPVPEYLRRLCLITARSGAAHPNKVKLDDVTVKLVTPGQADKSGPVPVVGPDTYKQMRVNAVRSAGVRPGPDGRKRTATGPVTLTVLTRTREEADALLGRSR